MKQVGNAPFEAVGGAPMIHDLVEALYDRVALHPDLKPIFPDDLTETARKQKQFLTQFLGGPRLYSEEHGHPMLRARHLPFPITPERAKAWLSCMNGAMEEVNFPEPWREQFFDRLTKVAHHMVNTEDSD